MPHARRSGRRLPVLLGSQPMRVGLTGIKLLYHYISASRKDQKVSRADGEITVLEEHGIEFDPFSDTAQIRLASLTLSSLTLESSPLLREIDESLLRKWPAEGSIQPAPQYFSLPFYLIFSIIVGSWSCECQSCSMIRGSWWATTYFHLIVHSVNLIIHICWVICGLVLGFPDGSNGKRICPQCGRPWMDPWVGKISWKRA